MPRTDLTCTLDAPVEKVYGILNDFMTLPRWNITVNGIKEIEKDKYLIDSTVGEVTNIVIKNVPNKEMASTQENSPMQKIGYDFEAKGDKTEVTLWTEFELEDQKTILDMAADLFLKSLKAYVDYVMEGGNPEEYEKKFGVIKKVKL